MQYNDMYSARLLAERWKNLPIPDLKEILQERSAAPFGRTGDGLVDLRGLLISGAVFDVRAIDVDFSMSRMGASGQLGGAFRAVRCRFDDCRYESSLDGDFEECVFRRANLSTSTLAGRFIDCDFSAASISGARGVNLEFRDCLFAASDFRKALFHRCRFEGCHFISSKFGKGSFAASQFQDCTFEIHDWKDTILDRATGLAPTPL